MWIIDDPLYYHIIYGDFFYSNKKNECKFNENLIL